MKKEKPPTERVAMVWPVELKEAARSVLGNQRGLTAFVLEAVESKLGRFDLETQLRQDLKESREVAQRLADTVVTGYAYAGPQEQLQEVGLPHWLNTTGWPSDLARLVPPGPVMAARVATGATEQPQQPQRLERQPAEPLAPAAARADDDAADQPAASGGEPESMFERVQRRAKQMGVEIDEGTLRPASQLSAPTATTLVETSEVVDAARERQRQQGLLDRARELQEAEEQRALQLASVASAPPARDHEAAPTGPTEPDTCPECGAILVDGACFECF